MRPDREGISRKLRDECPMSWHEEPAIIDDETGEQYMDEGPGFWAVTRYADVMQVSRDPDTFRSESSINIRDIPHEIAEWLGSMINMDAPPPTKMRLIVNRGFTPKHVARLQQSVRDPPRDVVDHV